MANAMDEYDIRRAFDVLDPCQDGVVTLNDLQTLYLGLGYVPPKTVPELRSLVRQHQQADDDDDNDDENRVTLETTLKLLSKVHFPLSLLPTYSHGSVLFSSSNPTVSSSVRITPLDLAEESIGTVAARFSAFGSRE